VTELLYVKSDINKLLPTQLKTEIGALYHGSRQTGSCFSRANVCRGISFWAWRCTWFYNKMCTPCHCSRWKSAWRV